ncbi:MAG: B3/4 domain-containing protein [Gammaproteobacteria bacterium]
MRIVISSEILSKFPQISVGVLVAKVEVLKSHPYVEKIKEGLSDALNAMGVKAGGVGTHPDIAVWRKIYKSEFGVDSGKYPSAIESLVKRVAGGKKMWDISSVVDLYNSVAVSTLLPMGAYDASTIKGDVILRYGKSGEIFRGLGSHAEMTVDPKHIVYADSENVLTWLWNHKDAEHCGVTEKTQYAIFFADSAYPGTSSVKKPVELLAEHLKQIGCTPIQMAVLDRNSSEMRVEISDLRQSISLGKGEVGEEIEKKINNLNLK